MLEDILLKDGVRPLLVDTCVELVEQEVARKSGLSGIGIKGAFALVQKAAPGFVPRAINKLAPEFVQALEPFFDPDAPEVFEAAMMARSDACADALLAVTDHRVASSQRRNVGKAYKKLRPIAKKQVGAAVPGLAKRLQRLITTA